MARSDEPAASTLWDSNVLLPAEILAESPSARDGVSAADELAYRVWGCEVVQEGTILLRLPQVVACTGQNLFHRFFYRKSLKRFDAFAVAMGSVFLATKIEERPKRMRDVLLVFYHIYRKRKVRFYFYPGEGPGTVIRWARPPAPRAPIYTGNSSSSSRCRESRVLARYSHA